MRILGIIYVDNPDWNESITIRLCYGNSEIYQGFKQTRYIFKNWVKHIRQDDDETSYFWHELGYLWSFFGGDDPIPF